LSAVAITPGQSGSDGILSSQVILTCAVEKDGMDLGNSIHSRTLKFESQRIEKMQTQCLDKLFTKLLLSGELNTEVRPSRVGDPNKIVLDVQFGTRQSKRTRTEAFSNLVFHEMRPPVLLLDLEMLADYQRIVQLCNKYLNGSTA
jgi:hypothetical protein